MINLIFIVIVSTQCWSLFTTNSIIVSSQKVESGRNADQQRMYEELCLHEGENVILINQTTTMSSVDKMRRMCMCGLLRDAFPPDPTLKSIRTTTSPFEYEDHDNSKTSRTSNAIPCIKGNVIAGSVSYPCSSIDLLSYLSLAELNMAYGSPSHQLSSLWGWSDGVHEIAIVGTYSGATFVDITNPNNPVYIGKLPPPKANGLNSYWRDVKVYKNYAYIVSEAGNMQYVNMNLIVDAINKLPPQGILLTKYAREFGNTTLTNAHTIALNEESGYAYLVGTNLCNGGLFIVDVRLPFRPRDVGCFGGDGYVHEVQCVIYRGSDLSFSGKEICFCCNEDTVTIIDVTLKSNPVILSRTSYVRVGFTHQGWVTDDHDYFIFGDEIDEKNSGLPSKTLVLDLRQLNSPKIVGYHFSSKLAVDHNLYVIGKYVYQANYRAGLRVLRMDDIASASLSEVGYFDIFPNSDSFGFNGAWNVYPFFPSRTIIVSGIEQGLFVLKSNINDKTPSIRNGSCKSHVMCLRKQKGKQVVMKKKFFNRCISVCMSWQRMKRNLENGWTCGIC